MTSVYSTVVAKAKDLKAEKNGGKLNGLADICIIVPENETFMLQELHLQFTTLSVWKLKKPFGLNNLADSER